jgi:hypothetical protein
MTMMLETEPAAGLTRFQDPDVLLAYSEVFDDYGIIYHDGGESRQIINYCPWCGAKLPDSKRDRWFDELEKLGIDDPIEQEYPEKYKTSAWWKIDDGNSSTEVT